MKTRRVWGRTEVNRGESINESLYELHGLLDVLTGKAEDILTAADNIADEIEDPCMKRQVEEQKIHLKKMMQYLEGYIELEFTHIVTLCSCATIKIENMVVSGFKDNDIALQVAEKTLQQDDGYIVRWKGAESAINELGDTIPVRGDPIEVVSDFAGRLVAKRIMESNFFINESEVDTALQPKIDVVAHLER